MNDDIAKGFDDGKEQSLGIRLEKVERVPSCLAFHLAGYIDAYNHHYFQQKVAMAIEAGFTRLVLDMRGINFIGSTGVGGGDRAATDAMAPETLAYVCRRQTAPNPRLEVAPLLGPLGATAAIDLSDGLASDAEHLCRQSGVGIRIEAARLPVAPATAAAGRVRLEVRLVAVTPTPSVASIAPYTRALVAYTYEVTRVLAGDCRQPRILVAHWAIRDRQILDLGKQVGGTYVLEVEPFEARPELEGERLLMDTDEFHLPLYYEPGP
mgnify:CR=1 FL=1